MQDHPDSAVRSHESLIQRCIFDEERFALARLSNAIVGIEQTSNDDLADRLGSYFRAYQLVRTWIAQGVQLTGVDLQTYSIFQEWRRLDRSFLDELRRFTGPSRYDRLRRQLDSVGWGENITRDLTQLVP
jgi:hypothetical protein